MKFIIEEPVVKVVRIPEGVPGKSAYEIAVIEEGFEGTLAEWIESLEGASVWTDEGPPADEGRKDGQPYINALTGDVYRWEGETWNLKGSIKGVKGDKGDIGPAAMAWKGLWDAGVDYEKDDAVGYDGSSWFASDDPPLGEVPSGSSSYWHPLALQGSQGDPGPSNVLTVEATTLAPGSEASVSISGTSPTQHVVIGVPRGDQGIQGPQGDKGDKGDRGDLGPEAELPNTICHIQHRGTTAPYAWPTRTTQPGYVMWVDVTNQEPTDPNDWVIGDIIFDSGTGA